MEAQSGSIGCSLLHTSEGRAGTGPHCHFLWDSLQASVQATLWAWLVKGWCQSQRPVSLYTRRAFSGLVSSLKAFGDGWMGWPCVPLARLNRKVAGGSCGWWGWCLRDTGSHGGTSIVEDFPHAFHREDKTELCQKPESKGPQASDASKGRLAGPTQGRARVHCGASQANQPSWEFRDDVGKGPGEAQVWGHRAA